MTHVIFYCDVEQTQLDRFSFGPSLEWEGT